MNSELGWWVISGEDLLALLHEVAGGEDPDIAYASFYANSEVKTNLRKGDE